MLCWRLMPCSFWRSSVGGQMGGLVKSLTLFSWPLFAPPPSVLLL